MKHYVYHIINDSDMSKDRKLQYLGVLTTTKSINHERMLKQAKAKYGSSPHGVIISTNTPKKMRPLMTEMNFNEWKFEG